MKKNILILTFSIGVVAILVIAGCTKDTGKLPVSVVPVSVCDTITYTKHIKPIIDAKCISCHGNPLSGGAPVFLTSYAEVKLQADNGNLKATAIDGNPVMPYGGPPLPQSQKDLITCWLNNGKKQ